MNIAHRLLIVVLAAFALAACAATEPNEMHRISVSAATGVSADLIVGGEGGSVSIASAQIVLSRLKLHDETCAGGDEGDAADDDDDCPPLTVGPVLIDLPLDGSTTIVLDALVPAGTYQRLQARLHAVKPGDPGVGDFLTAHPELEGVSVKVVGVFSDAEGADHEFTFISRMNVVSAINFDEPVTVDAGTTNLTVNVDVGSWFAAAGGGVVAPTNAANQPAIEKTIRRSLRAFEDDDHDGDADGP